MTKREIDVRSMSVPALFTLLVESVGVVSNIAEALDRLFNPEASRTLNGAGPDRQRAIPVRRKRRRGYKSEYEAGYGSRAEKAKRAVRRDKQLAKLAKHFTSEDIEKRLHLTGHDRSRWTGLVIRAGSVKKIGKGVYEQVAHKE